MLTEKGPLFRTGMRERGQNPRSTAFKAGMQAGTKNKKVANTAQKNKNERKTERLSKELNILKRLKKMSKIMRLSLPINLV